MTDLVAVLSTGKGTWGHVSRLIADGDFENIFLITNDFGRENYSGEKDATMCVVNSRAPMDELIAEIKEQLKGKLSQDVALNLISGSGKEHMALLSALISMEVQFRMVALTTDGIKEI